MTKDEFKKLKVGDHILITIHGKNKGKRGIVREIKRDEFNLGIAYIEPMDCEFEFYEGRGVRNKDGLYGWNQYGIKYPGVEARQKKEFVVNFNDSDYLSWTVNDYTSREIVAIERFLNELSDHTSGLTINKIGISSYKY